MKGINSIKTTPYLIVEKREDATLIISNEGKCKILEDTGILMKSFNQGDYIFQDRIVGNGFVRYNYTKMSKKDIEQYFPFEETEEIFSKFKDSTIFKSLK